MLDDVRRVVTGYGAEGTPEVSSDEFLPAGIRGPAGFSTQLWATPGVPVSLEDDGTNLVPGGIKWYLVRVPPDKHRGAAVNDFEAGVLHEKDTVDLIVMLSGEMWLELDGVAEWTRLKAGDTLVQRATMHAWHNTTDETAVFTITIIPATRTAATPNRARAGDHNFSAPFDPAKPGSA